MGYNTVAMLLNDHMDILEKSPKTLTYALTHPPMSERELKEGWSRDIRHYAEQVEEQPVHFGNGINLLPTFHADDVHFLYAGKNTLERLAVLRFSNVRINRNGKGPKAADYTEHRAVTLLLPDWSK